MYQVQETQIIYSRGTWDKTIIPFIDVCDIEGLPRMVYSKFVEKYGDQKAKFYIDEAIELMRKEGKIR